LYYLGLSSIVRHNRNTNLPLPEIRSAAWGHPYPGIRPFRTQESPFFFGREDDIQSVIDRLSVTGVAMLCGESGVGKSSLLYAGLIPRFEVKNSNCIVFRPMECGDPYLSLVHAVCPHLEEIDKENLVADLIETGDPHALARFILSRAVDHPVILAIDQLEEMWSARISEDDRHKFLVIVERIRNSLRWSLLFILRSEFVERLLEEDPLRKECRDGLMFLAPLTEAGIIKAITLPAELIGIGVADTLLAKILSERDPKGIGLPLLSCALRETFERANRRNAQDLTLADYESFNGLYGVVDSLCREAIHACGDDANLLLDGFFSPLVEIEPLTGKPLRRTASRVEWSRLQKYDELLNEFVSRGLLVSDINSKGEAIIEVSHEAIFFAWGAFDAWIQDRKDDLRRIRRMQRDAITWEEGGRMEADMYLHERLEEVKFSLAAINYKTTNLEDEFLLPEAERIWKKLDHSNLAPQERANYGDRLAKIGDQRFGIGVSTLNIPEFDWVDCSPILKTADYAHLGFTKIFVSRFLVTVKQYAALMAITDFDERENLPVVRVSWDDATEYAKIVSKLEGQLVRLPTVSEWQQLAENGNAKSLYPWGDSYIEGIANTQAEGLNRRVAVGVFCHGKNSLEIYDLIGNVWEWCSDTTDNNTRFLRGGSYLRKRDGQVNNKHSLCLEKNYRDLDLGFRLWKFL